MELLQLKYFCDAAETQNFSSTAKKFCVPPPDISQTIKRLERELGVDLFTRRANRVELNQAGKDFYENVSTAIGILESARKSVIKNKTETVKIAINVNRRIILNVTEKFRELYPNVIFSMKFGINPLVEDSDVIVHCDIPVSSRWDTKKIMSEPVYIAMRSDNPFANAEKFAPEMLRDNPIISMVEGSWLYKTMNEICVNNGIEPFVAMQSDDPHYVRKCVELGLGVALIPGISWKGLFSPEADIVFKKVDNYMRDTYIAYDRRKGLSPNAKKFVALLEEKCKFEQDSHSVDILFKENGKSKFIGYKKSESNSRTNLTHLIIYWENPIIFLRQVSLRSRRLRQAFKKA